MILDKPSKTQINILGTDWTISVEPMSKKFDDRYADAYIDNSTKTIYVAIHRDEPDNVENLVEIRKQYTRHEIIHAFFYECGLGASAQGNSCWAQNEEMVDWWALNFYKVEKVFKELRI